MRIANAPVSWGIFELTSDNPHVPGPDHVLAAMAEIGYAGTELGPRGFLGTADQAKARLGSHGLKLVGAFLPMRLSRDDTFADDMADLRLTLDLLEAVCDPDDRPKAVLSDLVCDPTRMSYVGRAASYPETRLHEDAFRALVANLHRAAELCLTRGFDPVLHPHGGSFIETDAEVRQTIDAMDTSMIGLCLDTGHALLGGSDPLDLVREYGQIIRHVHIKDCDAALLADVIRDGGGLYEAWEQGVFCELGRGSSGVELTVRALTRIGYDGWLVVEQDHIPSAGESTSDLSGAQLRNFQYLKSVMQRAIDGR